MYRLLKMPVWSFIHIHNHHFTGLWGKPLSACHVQSSAPDPQSLHFVGNDETFLRLLQPRYSSASRFPSPDFLSKPWITTLAQKNVGFTNGNLSGLRDRGWKGIQRPLPAVCQVFSLHGRRHCLCYNMYVCKIVSEKRIITMICTNCDVLFSGKIKCHTIYTISDYVVLNGLVKHIYQNMT